MKPEEFEAQLVDLKRSKHEWESDPVNRSPFPLNDLIETLEAKSKPVKEA